MGHAQRSAVALAIFMLACGQPMGADGGIDAPSIVDAGNPIDAGPNDAGEMDAFVPSDAGADAGTPGPVSITLAFGGALAEGLPVVFQNADHSVVDTVMTDASGRASAVMAPGGSVSAVYPQTGFVSIFYFLEVEPGDELRVGRPDPVVSNVSVMVPAAIGTSPRYWVLSRCGGVLTTSTSDTMRILPGCTRADVFVGATQNALPYGDYGAFLVPDVDLSGAPVDLRTHTYAPATMMTQRMINTPATMRFANSHVWVTTASAGTWFAASSGQSAVDYPSMLTPTAMLAAYVPTIGATEMMIETVLAHTGPTGNTSVRRIHERLAYGTSYELDVSTLTIPVLTEPVTMDETGLVAWSEEGGSADWVNTLLRTTRGVETIDHVVTAPHRGTTIQLPPLPADLAVHNPQAGDTVEPLFFLVGSSPGGYDAFRQFEDSDLRPLLPSTGDRSQVSSVL